MVHDGSELRPVGSIVWNTWADVVVTVESLTSGQVDVIRGRS